MAQTAQRPPAAHGHTDLDRRIERLSATLLSLPSPYIDVAFPNSFDQTGSFALALREFTRLPKEQQAQYLRASTKDDRSGFNSASTSSGPASRSSDAPAGKAAGHVGLTPNRSTASTTYQATPEAKHGVELPGRLHSGASPRSIVNAVKQQGLQGGQLAPSAPADLARPVHKLTPKHEASSTQPSNPPQQTLIVSPSPTQPTTKPSRAPHPHSSDPPTNHPTPPKVPLPPSQPTPSPPLTSRPAPPAQPSKAPAPTRPPAPKPPAAPTPTSTLLQPIIRLQPSSPTKRLAPSQHPAAPPAPKHPRPNPPPPTIKPPTPLPDRPRPPQATMAVQTSPPRPPPTTSTSTAPMPLPITHLHATHAAMALTALARSMEDPTTPPAGRQQQGKQCKHQGDRERAAAGGRWTTTALSSYVESALHFLDAARLVASSNSGQARDLLVSTAQMLNSTWTEPPTTPAPHDPPLKPTRLLLQLLLCHLQATAYSHALLLTAPKPLETLRGIITSWPPPAPAAAPPSQPAPAARSARQHAPSQGAPMKPMPGHQRPSPGDSNASTQDRIETSPPFRDPPPPPPPPPPSQPRRTFGNPRRAAAAQPAPPAPSVPPMLPLDLLDHSRGLLDARSRAAQLTARLLPLAVSLPAGYAALIAVQAMGVEGMQGGLRERLVVARRALGTIKQAGQAAAAPSPAPAARVSLGGGSGVLEMEAAAQELRSAVAL